MRNPLTAAMVVRTAVIGIVIIAVIGIVERLSVARLTSLTGISVRVSDTEYVEKTLPPSQSPAPDGAPFLAIGTVAIQTFGGAKMIRAGSGTVVSSDGLVLTTTSVAPYGSGSYVYQVATADGSLLRGRSVWRHGDLVLLEIPAADPNAIPFDDTVFVQAGQVGVAVGAMINVSSYTTVVVPSAVVYAIPGGHVAMSVDRAFSSVLGGARVVNEGGRSIGILQMTGTTWQLIPAATLNAFIQRYLETKKL